MNGDLNLQVWVEMADGTTQKAVELLLTSVAYQGSLLIENGYDLCIQIQQVYVDKITVVYTGIGFLSAATLKFELNNGFKLFTPYINKQLQNHSFTVPSNIFGIFTLSNLTIGYYNDYLYLGMTPTFIAPSYTTVAEQLAVYQ